MREGSLTLALRSQHLCFEQDATAFKVIAQRFPLLGRFNLDLGVNLPQLLHQEAICEAVGRSSRAGVAAQRVTERPPMQGKNSLRKIDPQGVNCRRNP
jgi:hypothetical protein